MIRRDLRRVMATGCAAFCATTGLLLNEVAAKDRIELNNFTCKQFLEMSFEDALVVTGWLQGYYLDEHAPPVVDFDKLSVESKSLVNRCAARPDQGLMTAAESLFGK